MNYPADSPRTKNKPQFILKHIGINPGEGDAAEIAAKFARAIDMETIPGNSSIFVGTAVEVMRRDFLGRSGHIAFETEDIESAAEYLKEKGCDMDMSTVKYSSDGRIKALYLAGDFGGFAVHLVRK